MIVFRVIGIGIVSTILILILKEEKSEMALMCAIAASIIILLYIISQFTPIVNMINKLLDNAGINKEYLRIILKIVGISYMVEFGKNICKDAGENAIANKIEIAGKVVIISLSIPVVNSLVEIVSNLIWKKKSLECLSLR